jgi:hypothetical protein
MKWMQPVIICAAALAFAGCNSSTTQSGPTPDTNAPSAQTATPEQVLDTAMDTATAAVPASVSTPEAATAPAPAPAPAQN